MVLLVTGDLSYDDYDNMLTILESAYIGHIGLTTHATTDHWSRY